MLASGAGETVAVSDESVSFYLFLSERLLHRAVVQLVEGEVVVIRY